jgi:hypothetical protein
MPFPQRDAYERFLYALSNDYPEIQSSTLPIYTNSPTTGLVRGTITFKNGMEIHVFEYLDFSDGEILSYHYAIRHAGDDIRWYDPQPHPGVAALAATFPHHLHEPPDIKHNRKPAQGIRFDQLNLPTLIADCMELGVTLSQ